MNFDRKRAQLAWAAVPVSERIYVPSGNREGRPGDQELGGRRLSDIQPLTAKEKLVSWAFHLRGEESKSRAIPYKFPCNKFGSKSEQLDVLLQQSLNDDVTASSPGVFGELRRFRQIDAIQQDLHRLATLHYLGHDLPDLPSIGTGMSDSNKTDDDERNAIDPDADCTIISAATVGKPSTCCSDTILFHITSLAIPTPIGNQQFL